jgi:hypothetical protein
VKKFQLVLASSGLSVLGFLVLVYFGTFTPRSETQELKRSVELKLETKADKKDLVELGTSVQNILAIQCYKDPRACSALRISVPK